MTMGLDFPDKPTSKCSTNEEGRKMPLWKVYHPAGAFTAEDKKALAKRVTEVYARVPIPKFYVVFIYEEIPRTLALSVAS